MTMISLYLEDLFSDTTEKIQTLPVRICIAS